MRRLVKFYDESDGGKTLRIGLEMPRMETLKSYLEYIYNKSDRSDRIHSIIKDMTTGVHHLHDKCKILHNDIALRNFLVDRSEKGQETVLICDFGLATGIREQKTWNDLEFGTDSEDDEFQIETSPLSGQINKPLDKLFKRILERKQTSLIPRGWCHPKLLALLKNTEREYTVETDLYQLGSTIGEILLNLQHLKCMHSHSIFRKAHNKISSDQTSLIGLMKKKIPMEVLRSYNFKHKCYVPFSYDYIKKLPCDDLYVLKQIGGFYFPRSTRTFLSEEKLSYLAISA